MKAIGICGSPRKGWNTETLVTEALAGAASVGAETELIHLYDEPIKGCMECFACKRKGNKTGGICAIRDNLRPILEKAYAADVMIIGSPNFFGYPSGMVRSFIERFLYPLASYEIKDGKQVRILGNRIIPAGMIFTMNVNEHFYGAMHYETTLGATCENLKYVLGYAEQYNSCDTLQFQDYSKMDANMFDAAHKARQHEVQFPIDRKNCYDMGKRLVEKAKEVALK